MEAYTTYTKINATYFCFYCSFSSLHLSILLPTLYLDIWLYVTPEMHLILPGEMYNSPFSTKIDLTQPTGIQLDTGCAYKCPNGTVVTLPSFSTSFWHQGLFPLMLCHCITCRCALCKNGSCPHVSDCQQYWLECKVEKGGLGFLDCISVHWVTEQTASVSVLSFLLLDIRAKSKQPENHYLDVHILFYPS